MQQRQEFHFGVPAFAAFCLVGKGQAVTRMATVFGFLTFFWFWSRTFFCMAARLPEIARKSELTILFVTTA